MKFIDMHCDTLMQAYIKKNPTITNMPSAMVDVERMLKGNTLAEFFAIFLPPVGIEKMLGLPGPIIDDEYIKALHKIYLDTILESSDKIAAAHNADEMLQNEKNGKMSAFLTIEDGRSVNGSFEKLKE